MKRLVNNSRYFRKLLVLSFLLIGALVYSPAFATSCDDCFYFWSACDDSCDFCYEEWGTTPRAEACFIRCTERCFTSYFNCLSTCEI